MNVDYIPHNWVLLKITGDTPHYRIFASWRGSYTSGDSWRMNSGITSVEEDEFYYYFFGHSGSIYKCHKKCYGNLGPYAESVLGHYVNRADGKLEVITKMPDSFIDIEWNPK